MDPWRSGVPLRRLVRNEPYSLERCHEEEVDRRFRPLTPHRFGRMRNRQGNRAGFREPRTRNKEDNLRIEIDSRPLISPLCIDRSSHQYGLFSPQSRFLQAVSSPLRCSEADTGPLTESRSLWCNFLDWRARINHEAVKILPPGRFDPSIPSGPQARSRNMLTVPRAGSTTKARACRGASTPRLD